MLEYLLESGVHTRILGSNILPPPRTFNLIPGSYFMQMPTQDGRHALVVFPPGEQSKNDIRHMYELQDEEESPELQVLQRVVFSVSETPSYKCLLSAPFLLK